MSLLRKMKKAYIIQMPRQQMIRWPFELKFTSNKYSKKLVSVSLILGQAVTHRECNRGDGEFGWLSSNRRQRLSNGAHSVCTIAQRVRQVAPIYFSAIVSLNAFAFLISILGIVFVGTRLMLRSIKFG